MDSLVRLCQSRGLDIDDRDAASEAFSRLGYYRLSGYMLSFQEKGNGGTSHTFLEGVSFKDVLDAYTFDRKLRLVVMDAVERIEISIRAIISDVMSLSHGPHWFLNPAGLGNPERKEEIVEKIREAVDQSRGGNGSLHIAHYYETYDDPPFPPSWMVFEVLSFGLVSKIYTVLPSEQRKAIASRFGFTPEYARSWFHMVSQMRNICAHHGRLWNRVFGVVPKRAKNYDEHFREPEKFSKKLYCQIAVLKILLDEIDPQSDWTETFKMFIAKNPHIDLGRMGFPEGWEGMDLWR